MQQSNAYIIAFATGLTIVLGGLLSITAVSLKDRQQREVKLETRKQILSAVMNVEGKSKQELSEIYDKRIASITVNYDGEIIEDVVAEEVKVDKQYKLKPEDRNYPVFKFMSEADPNKLEAVIVPVYGFGLWDYIWGYVALEENLSTVKGVSFDHKAETPGLGARITDSEIQQRYQGKNIYDQSGELVAVKMLKGESNSEDKKDMNHIDGMSGATITGNGVNDMLKNYLTYYESYFKSLKGTSSMSSL